MPIADLAAFTAGLDKIETTVNVNDSSNFALDQVMLCLHDAEQLDKSAAERRIYCLRGAWWFFNTWKSLAKEDSNDADNP